VKDTNIPPNVIRRMPRYLRVLDDLLDHNVESVSSRQLGDILDLTASQIRQDFSRFGEFGQQGYGYNVALLRDEVASILGIGANRTAVLFGTGNLGRALLNNFNFKKYGFRVLAAFDVDTTVVGSEIAGVPVYDIGEFKEFVRENKVDVAVLTVPGNTTAPIVGEISKAGIKSVWNFTNVELQRLSNTYFESIHFSDSLLTLGYHLVRQYEYSKE